jgi:hypothetical protein
MLAGRLGATGLRSWHLQFAPFASVGLVRTLDPHEDGRSEERGNAERRALFVGLWPPMLWLIGDTIERYEQQRLGGRADNWPGCPDGRLIRLHYCRCARRPGDDWPCYDPDGAVLLSREGSRSVSDFGFVETSR